MWVSPRGCRSGWGGVALCLAEQGELAFRTLAEKLTAHKATDLKTVQHTLLGAKKGDTTKAFWKEQFPGAAQGVEQGAWRASMDGRTSKYVAATVGWLGKLRQCAMDGLTPRLAFPLNGGPLQVGVRLFQRVVDRSRTISKGPKHLVVQHATPAEIAASASSLSALKCGKTDWQQVVKDTIVEYDTVAENPERPPYIPCGMKKVVIPIVVEEPELLDRDAVDTAAETTSAHPKKVPPGYWYVVSGYYRAGSKRKLTAEEVGEDYADGVCG